MEGQYSIKGSLEKLERYGVPRRVYETSFAAQDETGRELQKTLPARRTLDRVNGWFEAGKANEPCERTFKVRGN